MAEIMLTRGYVAIVDDADYAWLSQWKWHATSAGHGGCYAIRGGAGPIGARGTALRMHREIVRAPADLQVDHINGDTLDNRRENLRCCTHSENARNRGPKQGTLAGLKGVDRSGRNWRARIWADGKSRMLGMFATPQEAAAAYDKAARDLHGEFARLNFPQREAA